MGISFEKRDWVECVSARRGARARARAGHESIKVVIIIIIQWRRVSG